MYRLSFALSLLLLMPSWCYATVDCCWSMVVHPANEDAGFPDVQGRRTTDGVWVSLTGQPSACVGTSSPAPVGYDAFRLHWAGGALAAGDWTFTTGCAGHSRTKIVDWPNRSGAAPQFDKSFDLFCQGGGCDCETWAEEDHDCDGTPDECDPQYEDCDNGDIECDRCEDANGNDLCDPPHANPETGQPCENCGDNSDDLDCDGIPNEQDPDIDGDGIPNADDPDIDGDGIPNEDDPDIDGDGEPNEEDEEPCGNGSDACECLNPPPEGCDEPCENEFIDHDCDGIPNGCDKQYVGNCPDSNSNGVCDHCECDPSDPDYPECEDEPCSDPPANDHDCDGVPNECDKDYDAPGCLDANGDKICDHCQGDLPPTGPDPDLELPTAPQVEWDVPSLDLSGEAYEYDIHLPWVDGGTKQLHVSTDPSDWGSSGLVGQLPIPSLLWTSMNTVRQLVRLMLLVMLIWAFGARFLRLFHST